MVSKLIRMLLDGDDDVIMLPHRAEILRVEAQGEAGIAIVAVAPALTHETEARRFLVVQGYGTEFNGAGLRYVGSVGLRHVFASSPLS